MADLDVGPGPGPGSTSDSQQNDLQRALERLQETMLKSASIGLCLRGGLHAVSVLLSQLSSRKRRTKRSGAHLKALTLDTLKFAAFLAAFGGTYVAVDEGLGQCVGKERSKQWRAAVAGACAGPTILIMGSDSYSGLASYIFLRGLLLLIRCGNKPSSPGWLRSCLSPTRWEHNDTILMCLACSQLLQSWLILPHTLPPSYVRFLNTQAGKQLHVYNALKEWARRNSAEPSPLTSLATTPLAGRPIASPCEFIHPGMSCSHHTLKMVPTGFRRALSVYIPVYVIPALLVHRKNLLSSPVDISLKVVKGISRSSLFLAVAVALAWRGACIVHRGRPLVPPSLITSTSMYGLTVWIAGLATLLEKKSRRSELAMYCLSRALVSCSAAVAESRALPSWLARMRGDVFLFAAGLAAITHCYSDGDGCHRDVFKSKYLSVIDFVFGNSGFSKGSISHVPSSQEMLHLLLRSRRAYPTMHYLPRTHSDTSLSSRRGSLDLQGQWVNRQDDAASAAAAALASPSAPTLGGSKARSYTDLLPDEDIAYQRSYPDH